MPILSLPDNKLNQRNKKGNKTIKTKKSSIRGALIGIILAQLISVIAVTAAFSAYTLSTSLKEQVIAGLEAACKSYAQVLAFSEASENTNSDNLETNMHKDTGFHYTFFEGDTRKRSSID